ncbi:hypothetical protein XBO1_2520014 [Xenorhabdus bovienii str. oregonense]|uniref:Uncharacterized protein n=1 Tax=Xenorhabdus bovienii str. oregonense TaxID=1398202 RepID=A0A077P8U9_XENBV|nr:hypothetical protein XBO1_2520014 [Xenorhabdus bovienii str. oregonense]
MVVSISHNFESVFFIFLINKDLIRFSRLSQLSFLVVSAKK